MASVQCCKPVEQACNQGQHQNHSLGQKMFSVFKKEPNHHSQCNSHTSATKTQTHCSTQTAISHNGHGVDNNHTMSHGPASGTATNCTNCHEKTRTGRNNDVPRKRGLLQKIKDGISGNSDSDSSCSDSDSDDDKLRKKN